jgi:hypothetical protein
VLWYREVLTNRGVTANKPETIMKNNKIEILNIDKNGNTDGKTYDGKGGRKIH